MVYYFLFYLELVLDYGINPLAFLFRHYAMISFGNKFCTRTFSYVVGRVKFIELTTLDDYLRGASLVVLVKAVDEEPEISVFVPFAV